MFILHISLIKWCLMSICLVLEWWTGFLVKLIAPVLSQKIDTLSNFNPKSQRVYFIQRIWAQQLATAIYSAFVVDKATEFCFLLNKKTNELPRNWQVPLVLLRSSKLPAKSTSEYPTNLNSTFIGYHNPRLIVPSKYLNILLMTCRWDSPYWNLAQKHTLNIISSLLAVK